MTDIDEIRLFYSEAMRGVIRNSTVPIPDALLRIHGAVTSRWIGRVLACEAAVERDPQALHKLFLFARGCGLRAFIESEPEEPEA